MMENEFRDVRGAGEAIGRGRPPRRCRLGGSPDAIDTRSARPLEPNLGDAL